MPCCPVERSWHGSPSTGASRWPACSATPARCLGQSRRTAHWPNTGATRSLSSRSDATRTSPCSEPSPRGLPILATAMVCQDQKRHRHIEGHQTGPAPVAYSPLSTFRWDLARGRVARSDRGLADQVAVSLTELAEQLGPQGTVIFAPLAIGRHVDHIITRNAAARLGLPVVYYSDFPYSESALPDRASWNAITSFPTFGRPAGRLTQTVCGRTARSWTALSLRQRPDQAGGLLATASSDGPDSSDNGRCPDRAGRRWNLNRAALPGRSIVTRCPANGPGDRHRSLASTPLRLRPLLPVQLNDDKVWSPASATKAITCSSCRRPSTTPELWSVDTPRTPILARSTLKGTSTELSSSRLRSSSDRPGSATQPSMSTGRRPEPHRKLRVPLRWASRSGPGARSEHGRGRP